MSSGSNATISGSFKPEVTEFTGFRSEPAVKFAHPATDDHGNECHQEDNRETGVEERIDDDNLLWMEEAGRDI